MRTRNVHMTLRSAVQSADLCATINRLVIHNDPVELALLSDEQYADYLQLLNDEEAKRAICEAINRPDPRSCRSQTKEACL